MIETIKQQRSETVDKINDVLKLIEKGDINNAHYELKQYKHLLTQRALDEPLEIKEDVNCIHCGDIAEYKDVICNDIPVCESCKKSLCEQCIELECKNCFVKL